MKINKKLVALIVSLCMIMGMLSGCTSTVEGKALYDAMVKTQTIKSCQNDMKFTLRVDATGLTGQDKVQFEQIKAMLNGIEMSMSMKQRANADNTAVKAQANVEMDMGGMSIKDMGVWVDMDLNSKPLKLKEIIKLPAMLTAANPNMAGKEYVVMDLGELMQIPEANKQTQSMDYESLMKLSTELQAKATAFLGKYLAQYDPGFTFINDVGTRDIFTPESIVTARIYQVKLGDKAAKKLVRYTVNNLADNKDAMEFAAEYMKLIQKFQVPTPGVPSPTVNFEKIMADFEKEKPAVLAEFNKAMDQIEDIQLLGDKGLTLEYAVDENGYIVSQSTRMDLVVDLEKLNSIDGMKGNQSVGDGVYTVGFDYNMQTYGIDKEFAIEIPVVTPENSISYMDMLKPAVPVKPELTVDKKVTKVYNKITYLPAKNTVKLMKDATYVYSKGAATIKIGGNTFVVAPGKTTMKVNGKEVKLKALDGKIVNGRFYVSVEVIEQLGFNVILK